MMRPLVHYMNGWWIVYDGQRFRHTRHEHTAHWMADVITGKVNAILPQ